MLLVIYQVNRMLECRNTSPQCLHLASSFSLPDDAPTLRELISFPMTGCRVNVVEKIASYSDFGVMLLEDDDGSKMNNIEKEKRGNVSDIVRHIFMLWLQGKGRQPVTWATLIAVLRDIDLNALAQNVEDNLLP